jgi:hypothetical protein
MAGSPGRGVQALTILALLGLFGCDFFSGKRAGEAVAERIHEEIRLGNYSAIYTETSPGFREASPESAFTGFMQNLAGKVGRFKKATEIGYQMEYHSSEGKLYSLVYILEFDNAAVRETLVFISDNGKMLLRSINFAPVEQKETPPKKPMETMKS